MDLLIATAALILVMWSLPGYRFWSLSYGRICDAFDDFLAMAINR